MNIIRNVFSLLQKKNIPQTNSSTNIPITVTDLSTDDEPNLTHEVLRINKRNLDDVTIISVDDNSSTHNIVKITFNEEHNKTNLKNEVILSSINMDVKNDPVDISAFQPRKSDGKTVDPLFIYYNKDDVINMEVDNLTSAISLNTNEISKDANNNTDNNSNNFHDLGCPSNSLDDNNDKQFECVDYDIENNVSKNFQQYLANDIAKDLDEFDKLLNSKISTELDTEEEMSLEYIEEFLESIDKDEGRITENILNIPHCANKTSLDMYSIVTKNENTLSDISYELVTENITSNKNTNDSLTINEENISSQKNTAPVKSIKIESDMICEYYQSSQDDEKILQHNNINELLKISSDNDAGILTISISSGDEIETETTTKDSKLDKNKTNNTEKHYIDTISISSTEDEIDQNILCNSEKCMSVNTEHKRSIVKTTKDKTISTYSKTFNQVTNNIIMSPKISNTFNNNTKTCCNNTGKNNSNNKVKYYLRSEHHSIAIRNILECETSNEYTHEKSIFNRKIYDNTLNSKKNTGIQISSNENNTLNGNIEVNKIRKFKYSRQRKTVNDQVAQLESSNLKCDPYTACSFISKIDTIYLNNQDKHVDKGDKDEIQQKDYTNSSNKTFTDNTRTLETSKDMSDSKVMVINYINEVTVKDSVQIFNNVLNLESKEVSPSFNINSDVTNNNRTNYIISVDNNSSHVKTIPVEIFSDSLKSDHNTASSLINKNPKTTEFNRDKHNFNRIEKKWTDGERRTKRCAENSNSINVDLKERSSSQKLISIFVGPNSDPVEIHNTDGTSIDRNSEAANDKSQEKHDSNGVKAYTENTFLDMSNICSLDIDLSEPIEPDSDCSYHSSDFEFITEDEAKIDLLVDTNFSFRKNFDNSVVDANKATSSHNYVTRYKGFVDPNNNMPGPSNYQDIHVVPQGETYLNLFQENVYHPVISNIHFLENKSIRSSHTYEEFQGMGFDMRLMRPQSSDEENEEAGETRKRILRMYPAAIKKRRTLRRYNRNN